MAQAKVIHYYNNDKSIQAKALGNTFLGVFDKEDIYLGMITEKCGDMFKWECEKDVYLIRWFKRKGFCTFYRIANNNIDLYSPEIWRTTEAKIQNHKWWEGAEGFEEFEELYNYFEEQK